MLLLLSTYGVLGWFIARHQNNWVPWLLQDIPQVEWWISILGSIFVSGFVTAPMVRMRRVIAAILKVDDWMLLASLVASSMLIFFFTHMDVVVKLIVLSCALLLARFDLTTLRWPGWSAFVLLSLVGTIGLGGGGLSHWAVVRYDIEPWSDVETIQLERIDREQHRSRFGEVRPFESNVPKATSGDSQSAE